jgi:hypothetical protein
MSLWSKLPTDIIRKIIEMSEPGIDVRRAFGIPPKRLDEAKCWKLWYLLKSHDGVVYNLETKSLHVFQPGVHVVRRPIELNYHTAGLLVFNDTEDEHVLEETQADGAFLIRYSSDAWVTEQRVLFKGAQPSRKLTIEDAMLLTG